MQNNNPKIGLQSAVQAGLSVSAYDVRSEAIETFKQAGGQGAATVAEAAQGADILVVVVLNGEQAEDVLFGSGNAATTLQAGSVVMLCCTVQPSFAQALAQRLNELGIEMLDAPMSGGPVRAAEGELTMMASGPDSAFDKAKPVLDAMVASLYRMGNVCGQGSTMKAINQLLAGVNLAVSSEAMAFGTRAGMDPQTIYDVISESAGNSWMFENRVPHILADDYSPQSAIDIWVKDLGIVLDTAKEMRFPLMLASTAHQLFMMTAGAGHGRLDDSAVVKIYEQLMDFKVIGEQE